MLNKCKNFQFSKNLNLTLQCKKIPFSRLMEVQRLLRADVPRNALDERAAPRITRHYSVFSRAWRIRCSV